MARRQDRTRASGYSPGGEAPRFIDMCCGSGSFLVEVVKLFRAGLTSDTVQEDGARAELVQVATGFDIDPLAVLLAKVNWVVAARDWLEPFDGSHPTTIPVYLADSLFGKTPLGDVDGGADVFELMLHDRSVSLPRLLVTPEYQHLFDAILEYGYSLAMASAARSPHTDVPAADLQTALDEAIRDSRASLPDDSGASLSTFFSQLVKALDALQGLGLNGIWSFVLRNCYRPALVLGQFNGVISNPPWLATQQGGEQPLQHTPSAECRGVRNQATRTLAPAHRTRNNLPPPCHRPLSATRGGRRVRPARDRPQWISAHPVSTGEVPHGVPGR